MNQELLTYVTAALRNGGAADDVRSALLGAGWPAPDVEEALAAASRPKASLPPPPLAGSPARTDGSAPAATVPAYESDPAAKKRGLFFLIAPFVGLILVIIASAIVPLMIASSAARDTAAMRDAAPSFRKLPGGGIELGDSFGPSLRTVTAAERTASATRAVLGLLGIVCVIGIIFGIPLGIILLLKKRLQPGSACDARSGQGSASVIPEEIRGWNWGAAGLLWIWGVYYSVWISLLSFIPVLSLIMMFYLGARGNALAWRKNRWADVASFRAAQTKWRIWGIIFFILSLLYALGQLLATMSSFYAMLSFVRMTGAAAY